MLENNDQIHLLLSISLVNVGQIGIFPALLATTEIKFSFEAKEVYSDFDLFIM